MYIYNTRYNVNKVLGERLTFEIGAQSVLTWFAPDTFKLVETCYSLFCVSRESIINHVSPTQICKSVPS